MRYSLTLQENHYKYLLKILFKSDCEQVAMIICGRAQIENDIWCGDIEERFLSRKIIELPDSQITSNSQTHVTWKTDLFIEALKEAEENDYAIALVHSHLTGLNSFSEIDDASDEKLFKLAFNRNDSNRPHASLVMTRDGNMFGRAWTSNLRSINLKMIRVVGNELKFFYPEKFSKLTPEIFHRQQLALGDAFTQDLSKLRVAVVGCGATGSATAFLLARLGIGNILLIDNDVVERTNLNRLHGSTTKDADMGKLKCEVLRDSIASIGIGCKVRVINEWVGSQKCHNVIKSCDIVFGCTDDHEGRLFLNRLAYFYLIPLIDMGLSIRVDNSDTIPKIRSLDGRSTYIFPGSACLLCRGTINQEIARMEIMKRNDPKGYERLKDEAYVIGEGNPSPAVVTFTTEVATLSVNILINKIQNYKGMNEITEVRRLFNRGEDLITINAPCTGCRICDNDKYWGRGDMEPFLNRIN